MSDTGTSQKSAQSIHGILGEHDQAVQDVTGCAADQLTRQIRAGLFYSNDSDVVNNQSTADAQGIFDERFRFFMGQFIERVDGGAAELAIAVVVDPKISDGPFVFLKGDQYRIARILAKILNGIKTEIMKELSVI